LARRVFEAFPNSFGASVHAERVGNPVRREIAAIASPVQRFAQRHGVLQLLVFGGSQGAARLNATVPAALARLPLEQRPRVVHQAGERNYQQAIDLYARHGVQAEVRAFIDDMAQAYADADLVVCRSGALTVAELAAAGVGSLLVPFAAAVDDHQTRNAQFLVDAEAAVLLPEAELTPERLEAELGRLFARGRDYLCRMAQNARERAIVDADIRIADACIALAGGAA
jgi:UDP-N-acetylglucosamine--N-acetylmuramyl-(pentapeptide) pyrophosphoryl-undecaprenol N-acetylglucosamine transferase